jgi:tetratricopeptide (TPR) repeat protein
MASALVTAFVAVLAAVSDGSRAESSASMPLNNAAHQGGAYDFVVASPQVEIDFKADRPVALSYKPENDNDWQLAGTYDPGKPIPLTFKRDGSYLVKLAPADGDQTPSGGGTKVYRCLVDLSPPLVEILAAHFGEGRLLVHWVAVDQHFPAQPIHIYLVNDQEQTLLAQLSNTSWAELPLDATRLSGPVRVKVTATDLAGHCAFSLSNEYRPATSMPTTTMSAVTTQPVPGDATTQPAPASTAAVLKRPATQPIDDEQARWHYKIGTIYRLKGDFQTAEAHLRQAAELSPKSIDPQIDLAAVLISLKRYNDAARVCEQALSLDPNRIEIWQSLGVACVRQNDFAQARACYEKLTSLDEKNVQGWISLGDACWMLGDHAEAMQQWQHARQLAEGQHLSLLVESADKRCKLLADSPVDGSSVRMTVKDK